MSSYGRGGQGGRRPAPGRRPDAVWSLLVIAAALVGGLAAAALVHTSIVITVIVSVAAGAIAVFAVARWPGKPVELTDGRPDGQERGLQGRPPSGPSRPDSDYTRVNLEHTRVSPEHTAVDPRYGRPGAEYTRPGIPARAESVVEIIPFSSRRDAGGSAQPGPRDWWQQPAAAPPTSSSAGRSAPAPDLSTYLGSAVIAQCPRCGAFDLDIAHDRDPWAFHCRACEATWAWRPGMPWPEVRVVPRLRRETRPPSP